MGKRREAEWREPFLAALANGASIKGAASAVEVCHTTAYGARGRFAARWGAALGEGRRKLERGDPPPLAPSEIVRSSRHGRPCVMRVGPDRGSAAKQAAFLAALAEGANVRRAAAAVSMSTTSLYARRQREPAFAEGWAAAVRDGYLDVEALLIENAKAVLGDAPRRLPKGQERRLVDDMTVANAINMQKLHRASVKGGAAQRYDWRAAVPDIEEVRAEALRRVRRWSDAALVECPLWLESGRCACHPRWMRSFKLRLFVAAAASLGGCDSDFAEFPSEAAGLTTNTGSFRV